MDIDAKIDGLLKRHPLLFLMLVILLTMAAGIVLLGAPQEIGLVYKAF